MCCLIEAKKLVNMQGMREAGLHSRGKEWCAPREMKTKLEQGLEEDTETIFLFLLIAELPRTGKRSGSGGVLIHKCSSCSRRHSRVVVSLLEPHPGELCFLFLSPPALLGRSQGVWQENGSAKIVVHAENLQNAHTATKSLGTASGEGVAGCLGTLPSSSTSHRCLVLTSADPSANSRAGSRGVLGLSSPSLRKPQTKNTKRKPKEVFNLWKKRPVVLPCIRDSVKSL
nr:uncharacterized protein LOC115497451 [Taeniopygia guttata]